MAKASNPPGPVILFSHGGFSYEYRESLGVGPHGEALVSQELVPGLLSPSPTGAHLPEQISTR